MSHQIKEVIVQVRVPVHVNDDGMMKMIRYADMAVSGSSCPDAGADALDSAERAVKSCLRHILGDI